MSGNRKRIWSLLTLIFLLSCSTISHGQNNQNSKKLVVAKHAFCLKVEKREPVGAAKEFSAGVGRVYFWTQINVTEPPTKIKHIWYHEDKKQLEVSLAAKYKRTRTWSYKNLPLKATGKWTVRVVDEKDDELGKFTFNVK